MERDLNLVVGGQCEKLRFVGVEGAVLIVKKNELFGRVASAFVVCGRPKLALNVAKVNEMKGEFNCNARLSVKICIFWYGDR